MDMICLVYNTLNLKHDKVLYECSQCGEKLPLFTLEDDIWYSLPIEYHRSVICLDCTINIIDRKLGIEDFRLGIPVNDWIFDTNMKYKYIHLVCKIFRCIRFCIREIKRQ